MLDFICDYKEIEEIRTLYESVEKLLSEMFSVENFIIISRPNNNENPKLLRTH